MREYNLHLTREEMLIRATGALNDGFYKLGYGGRDPTAPSPFRVDGGIKRCDCSGFVAWAGGLDRFQPHITAREAYYRRLDYDKTNGGVWFNTANIVNDAKAKTHTFYRQIQMKELVVPGDLVIYGPHPARDVKIPTVDGGFKMIHSRKRTYGHVGIITWVAPDFAKYRGRREGWGFKLKVAHCSVPNKQFPYATRVSDAGIWERDGNAILVRRVDMEI